MSQEPNGPGMGGQLRGARHLRVGIELHARSARVYAIWVVEQPSVQVVLRGQPLLVRIDLAGKPVLVQALADPRVTRGVYQKELGHSWGTAENGVLFVEVPFFDLPQLRDLRIRVLNVAKTPTGEVDPDALAALFDRPPPDAQLAVDLDAATLMRHPDWVKVSGALGVPLAAGRFEVYVDKAGEYRWRLLRGREIVADSGEGYATRGACEADLRWLRANAASASVAALDAPGSTPPPRGSSSRG